MDSKNKAMFIWPPLILKKIITKFNVVYSSLKSKILQPIHNPTIIYIKILCIDIVQNGDYKKINNKYQKI